MNAVLHLMDRLVCFVSSSACSDPGLAAGAKPLSVGCLTCCQLQPSCVRHAACEAKHHPSSAKQGMHVHVSNAAKR